MDVLLLAVGFALAIVIIGIAIYLKGYPYAALGGAVLLLLGFTVATSSITYDLQNATNSTFIYSNETIDYQVLNESIVSIVPFTFVTANKPIVVGSSNCYYTDNLTQLDSYVLSSSLGTINVTG